MATPTRIHSPTRPSRDAARTRQAILAAAQESFSTRGYLDARVRDITAAAGVNPALVSRYFGSKEQLFEQALAELLDASLLTNTPRDQFGLAIVQLLTANQPSQRNPLPMMLLASADPAARAITARLLAELILEPLGRWFGKKAGAERTARFVVIAAGLTVFHDVYPLEHLTGGMSVATRRWLVATIQALVDD